MYRYFSHLKKLEFVVTDACNGHCVHCSQGDHARGRRMLDPAVAVRAVRAVQETGGSIKEMLGGT